MGKSEGVQFITPPNKLQDKVLKIDEEITEPDFDALDDIVQQLGQEFVRRLPEELKAIGQELESLKAEPTNSARRAVLFRRVHDLKGQAGTYDYWLITVVGNDLCRFIEHAETIAPVHLQVMEYHVQAMTRVMRDKMTGKAPAGAQKMVDTLHDMVGKVLKQAATP
ncbi:hypothetical protein V5T82_01675 [Magnetovibrio sp. PR-2]|uniref:hypothetical protein n=1 Tax=Magnetovibrio sp. PR-2 TaxID=3120356 RepID=UPI002FCE57DF